MREKSFIGKGSQAFQPRSMLAFQAKSDGGRLENRKSWLMPHNSGLIRESKQIWMSAFHLVIYDAV